MWKVRWAIAARSQRMRSARGDCAEVKHRPLASLVNLEIKGVPMLVKFCLPDQSVLPSTRAPLCQNLEAGGSIASHGLSNILGTRRSDSNAGTQSALCSAADPPDRTQDMHPTEKRAAPPARYRGPARPPAISG